MTAIISQIANVRNAVLFAIVAMISLATPPVWADCQRSSDDIDVAIGLRSAPPFVWVDSVGDYHGLIDDLWSSIERELQDEGIIGETELIECPLGAQLDALAKGQLDIVISPLTITAERMNSINFSHQYLSSGITVATPSNNAIDLGQAFTILYETLTHDGVHLFIVIFLTVNLILALYMARALRQEEGYQHVIATEPRSFRFFRYVLEAITRTIGLRGMSEGLRSTTRTALEFVVAIVGTVFAAMIFGVITTALIGSVGGVREIKLQDLPYKRVATLENSTSQLFLTQLPHTTKPMHTGKVLATAETFETNTGGLNGKASKTMSTDVGTEQSATASRSDVLATHHCIEYEKSDATTRCITTTTWREAMEILARGEVEVVLGDWAQLTYLSRLPDFQDDLVVQSKTFRLEPYGWGISSFRPDLRAAIDRALLKRQRSPKWRVLVSSYLGTDRISPD